MIEVVLLKRCIHNQNLCGPLCIPLRPLRLNKRIFKIKIAWYYAQSKPLRFSAYTSAPSAVKHKRLLKPKIARYYPHIKFFQKSTTWFVNHNAAILHIILCIANINMAGNGINTQSVKITCSGCNE